MQSDNGAQILFLLTMTQKGMKGEIGINRRAGRNSQSDLKQNENGPLIEWPFGDHPPSMQLFSNQREFKAFGIGPYNLDKCRISAPRTHTEVDLSNLTRLRARVERAYPTIGLRENEHERSDSNLIGRRSSDVT